MVSGNKFYILSVDGGGIRGVFPAHILACMSERLGIDLGGQFDMLAGTSTGSIVVAGIACDLAPQAIVDLYKKHGSQIFKEEKSVVPKKVRPAYKSIYEKNELKKHIESALGEIRLGEIKKPLLMPATDVGYGGVHVFKSAYSEGFTRDIGVPLVDAVLASCSAPTYFDPAKVNEYLLADGGLWANNPSLAAVIDAQRRLGVDIADIKILSLGTGHARNSYGVNQEKCWGLLNGWKGKEFINFLVSLQAQSTHNYLQLLLKPEQVLRIDFESDQPLPLDDPGTIDDLISRADREFTHNSEKLKAFLST